MAENLLEEGWESQISSIWKNPPPPSNTIVDDGKIKSGSEGKGRQQQPLLTCPAVAAMFPLLCHNKQPRCRRNRDRRGREIFACFQLIFYIVFTWLLHGFYLVFTCVPSGWGRDDVRTILLWCLPDHYIVFTWFLHDFYLVLTWFILAFL